MKNTFDPSYRLAADLYIDATPINFHAIINQYLGIDHHQTPSAWVTLSSIDPYAQYSPHLTSIFLEGLKQRLLLNRESTPVVSLLRAFGSSEQITSYLEERPVSVSLRALMNHLQQSSSESIDLDQYRGRLAVTCAFEMMKVWRIANQNQIKIVLDFDRILVTQAGVICFTPHYIIEESRQAVGAMAFAIPDQWLEYSAPEEIIDEESPLHLRSIFSLSLMIYTLIYGRHPLQLGDTGDSMMVRLARLLKEEVIDPHLLCPHYPRSLCELIKRGVQYHPRDRPSTWSVYAQMLQEVSQELPILSRSELIALYQATQSEIPLPILGDLSHLPDQELIEYDLSSSRLLHTPSNSEE